MAHAGDKAPEGAARCSLLAEIDDPVLRLLAPLAAAYVARAGPAFDRRPTLDQPAPVSDGGELTPCLLRAVVAIDPEGRVPWRFLDRPDRRRPTTVDTAEDMIRVTVGGRPGARVVTPDRQGRLKLPQGLLRAVALSPGDRVAVLELDGPVFVLAPTRSGRFRIGAA